MTPCTPREAKPRELPDGPWCPRRRPMGPHGRLSPAVPVAGKPGGDSDEGQSPGGYRRAGGTRGCG